MRSANTLEEIRQALGETERNISLYKPAWSQLREHCFSMDLEIRWWRGQARLEDKDLGIDEGEDDERRFLDDNISLGTKRLLPKEYMREIRRIEQRTRAAFYRLTTKTDLGYVITTPGYVAFKRNIAEDRLRFHEIKETIYRDYDQIIRKVLEEYKVLAAKAWKLKNPTRPQPPQEFVRDYLDDIAQLIPDRDTIYRSFYFDWSISLIDIPVQTQEFTEAEINRLQSERDRIETQIEDVQNRLRRIKVDTAYRKQLLALEAERERLAEEAAAQRELAERVRRGAEERITRTISDFALRINQALYDVATDTLISLSSPANNGRMRGKVVVALRNWIEEVRSLNFLETEEVGQTINRLMSEMEGLLNTDSLSRNSTDVESVLRQVREIGAVNLLELTNRLPRSPREQEDPQLEIEDARSLARRVRRQSDVSLEIMAASAGETGGGRRRRGEGELTFTE